MTQIADPRWDEYARLQRILNGRRIVDDTTAGLEAALNSLLSTAVPVLPDETLIVSAQRAQASAMRRQRRRRGLLAQEEGHLFDLARADAGRPGDAALHARIEVARIFQVVTPAERDVVVVLAEGGDAAASLGVAPAAFRKRLQRLRDRLAA